MFSDGCNVVRVGGNYTVTLSLKGHIRHFTKWRIWPFRDKVTICAFTREEKCAYVVSLAHLSASRCLISDIFSCENIPRRRSLATLRKLKIAEKYIISDYTLCIGHAKTFISGVSLIIGPPWLAIIWMHFLWNQKKYRFRALPKWAYDNKNLLS